MRIRSTHTFSARGLDPYFTSLEAVLALLALAAGWIPQRIGEVACGDGAIVLPLRDAGFTVVASDIVDYGLPRTIVADYRTMAPPLGVEGIITNPPFVLAEAFLKKARSEVGYVALLVRTNFVMAGARRMPFLQPNPPTRRWLSAGRFPFMHRAGRTGPRSTSNTPHCWAIWHRGARRQFPMLFDWTKEIPNGDTHQQWRAAQ